MTSCDGVGNKKSVFLERNIFVLKFTDFTRDNISQLYFLSLQVRSSSSSHCVFADLNATVDHQYDALLMSNVVPMYPEFKSKLLVYITAKTTLNKFPFFLEFNLLFSPLLEIWDYFHSALLKKYASIYNGINVVMGPAFDYNYDGQYDAPEQIQQ